jgi:hypothetical protein
VGQLQDTSDCQAYEPEADPMRLILPAVVCALLVAWQPVPGLAAEPPDGAHDFDFNFGAWHTHIKYQTKALSGSSEFIVMEGTVTVRKVWDGRALLEEIETDGPQGHWEGMTLFLYNPQAHQWSQIFANAKNGVLQPPLIGSFKDGRGELYAQDTFNGRSILVRATWSDMKPDSHHFQEDYSDDGGKNWEPVFIADLTRIKP